MNKNRLATVAIAALTAFSAVVATTPAQAADFSVTADKSQNLAVAGDTVTITAANIPAGEGIYLRLCAGTLADVAKARPADCVGMDKTVWASTDAASIAQHASDATKALQVPVVAQFTSGTKTIDCTMVPCGIHVRRDHLGGATDFTLDRFIPVTFAVAAATPTPKPTAKATAKPVAKKAVKKVVKKVAKKAAKKN